MPVAVTRFMGRRQPVVTQVDVILYRNGNISLVVLGASLPPSLQRAWTRGTSMTVLMVEYLMRRESGRLWPKVQGMLAAPLQYPRMFTPMVVHRMQLMHTKAVTSLLQISL